MVGFGITGKGHFASESFLIMRMKTLEIMEQKKSPPFSPANGKCSRLRILLVGPYGGINLGDDLILDVIIEQLSNLNPELFISCCDPTFITNRYGVFATTLLEYRRWRVESIGFLNQVHVVIIGGGEQLSEPRLPNPIWGHFARVAHLARFSRLQRTPFMLWAVGLDQLRTPLSRWMYRHWICGSEAVLALRDDNSCVRAHNYGKNKCSIFRVADPAYLLQLENQEESRRFIFSEIGEKDDGKDIVLLVPAYDKMVSLRYLDGLIMCGQALAEEGLRVIGWTTDLQNDYDQICRRLPNWQNIAGFQWLPARPLNRVEFVKIVRAASWVVSARMHPLIVAITQGRFAFSLVRSSKMRAMADETKIPSIEVSELEKQPLLGLIVARQIKASFNMYPSYDHTLPEMRELALRSRQVFDRYILSHVQL